MRFLSCWVHVASCCMCFGFLSDWCTPRPGAWVSQYLEPWCLHQFVMTGAPCSKVRTGRLHRTDRLHPRRACCYHPRANGWNKQRTFLTTSKAVTLRSIRPSATLQDRTLPVSSIQRQTSTPIRAPGPYPQVRWLDPVAPTPTTEPQEGAARSPREHSVKPFHHPPPLQAPFRPCPSSRICGKVD